jgi:hypothetical protein
MLTKKRRVARWSWLARAPVIGTLQPTAGVGYGSGSVVSNVLLLL